MRLIYNNADKEGTPAYISLDRTPSGIYHVALVSEEDQILLQYEGTDVYGALKQANKLQEEFYDAHETGILLHGFYGGLSDRIDGVVA